MSEHSSDGPDCAPVPAELVALAHAVLAGDLAAAYALVDALQELRPWETCPGTAAAAAWNELKTSNSVRIRKALFTRPRANRGLQLSSLAELLALTPDDLLRCPNFGFTSLAWIRACLARHGFRLRGDDGPQPGQPVPAA